VFWINVPVGLAGAVIGWFVLPTTKDLPENAAFDWKGALLIAPALTALMALLNEGHRWGLISVLFVAFALAAIVLMTLFVRIEQRAAAPLMDLKLLRRPAFALGNIAGVLSYAALFGLFFLMPFVFVRAYGDSILAAGLRLSIVPVMLALAAPIAGALYDRLGARLPTVSGMLICGIGLCVLFAVADGAQATLLPVMIALAIFGIGQGLFISPNNSAIVAAAPPGLTGEAGGLLNVTRCLGVSIGIAAASSLLAWRIERLTGSGYNTLHASARDLLTAAQGVILLLGCFAALAGALSLLQTQPPRTSPVMPAKAGIQ
jgi:nitrate/nitrite transporter NarK